jgi:hypothetical protein
VPEYGRINAEVAVPPARRLKTSLFSGSGTRTALAINSLTLSPPPRIHKNSRIKFNANKMGKAHWKSSFQMLQCHAGVSAPTESLPRAHLSVHQKWVPLRGHLGLPLRIQRAAYALRPSAKLQIASICPVMRVRSNRCLLIKFRASECGHCRRLDPQLAFARLLRHAA